METKLEKEKIKDNYQYNHKKNNHKKIYCYKNKNLLNY